MDAALATPIIEYLLFRLNELEIKWPLGRPLVRFRSEFIKFSNAEKIDLVP
jgi:hypothetical protein